MIIRHTVKDGLPGVDGGRYLIPWDQLRRGMCNLSLSIAMTNANRLERRHVDGNTKQTSEVRMIENVVRKQDKM